MCFELGYSELEIKNRKQQIQEVQKLYNVDDFINLKLKPAHLEEYDEGEMIGNISKIYKEIVPELLILPFYGDAHSDHKYVFDWCYSAAKIFRQPSIKKIVMMEIESETNFARPNQNFIPNCWIDISDFMDKKLKALSVYNSEFGNHPFPRSEQAVRARAVLRGVEAGCEYAEAFRILREIK